MHPRQSSICQDDLTETVIELNIELVDVGDPGKESNASWAIGRGAHKKPTYAQMVTVSNRLDSFSLLPIPLD